MGNQERGLGKIDLVILVPHQASPRADWVILDHKRRATPSVTTSRPIIAHNRRKSGLQAKAQISNTGRPCATFPGGSRPSFPEKLLCEKQDIGRPLSQAAHEIRVPLPAEGDIDADVIASGGEVAL